MKIWIMNLKDDRDEKARNNDDELKFRLCLEKSILAIGWGLDTNFDNWQAYRSVADLRYGNNYGYPSAVNALQEMECGDLVWTQNPVTHEHYLAQIVDNEPSFCCDLKEFDIFGCRKANFVYVDSQLLNKFDLSGGSLSGRHAIERVKIQNIIDSTKQLFNSLK